MKKNLENLLGEALQNFPGIESGYIGIEYNPQVDNYAEISRDNFPFASLFPFLFSGTIDATIEVGDMFLSSNEDLQKALLIHEIGHYQNKDYSELAKEGLKYLNKNRFKRIIGNLTRKQRKRNRLALNAYIQAEILADNHVIRAGYGQIFLDLAREHYQAYKDKRLKESVKRRVDNLKEKLVGAIPDH